MNSWAGYVLVVMVSEERGEVSRSLNVCPVSWVAVVVPCPGRKCLRMKQGDRSCLHCPSCADSAVADTRQFTRQGQAGLGDTIFTLKRFMIEGATRAIAAHTPVPHTHCLLVATFSNTRQQQRRTLCRSLSLSVVSCRGETAGRRGGQHSAPLGTNGRWLEEEGC